MTGWKLVFLGVAIAALMLQDTASAWPTHPQCPKGVPYYFCLFNPCFYTRCPRFPDARCEADYCGGCTARFFVGKTEVTDHCYRDFCLTEDGDRIECDGLCGVDPFTSEPYCNPSCDINNGGCADDEECVQGTIYCIRAPCPQPVFCQPKENPCKLQPNPGPCEAYIPSYFFNSTSGRCENFVYGGCGGNDNRFSLLEDCREKCGEDPCNCIECVLGTICQVNELTGEAECVPRTHPCAAILCGPGTICRVNPDTQTGYCGVDPCTFTRCGAGTVCQYNEEIDNSECVPADEEN